MIQVPKTPEKKVYKNPKMGTPLISTIVTGCKTPILEVKFCNLVNPYFYPNSPTIPRHSVTCLVDQEDHKEFLNAIQTIEKNEHVESILKNEITKSGTSSTYSGKLLIKFQSKDIIPIFEGGEFKKGETPKVELEDELAPFEKIMIVYDVLRYTKKNTTKTEHGLSFKPTCIYYYPKAE